jgi:hypothetical protein
MCCAAGAAPFIKPDVMEENIHWVACDQFQEMSARVQASKTDSPSSDDEVPEDIA